MEGAETLKCARTKTAGAGRYRFDGALERATIGRETVLNLTDRLDGEGRLNWDVPEGGRGRVGVRQDK